MAEIQGIHREVPSIIKDPEPVTDAPIDNAVKFNDGDLILQAATVASVLEAIDAFCVTAHTRSLVSSKEVVNFCLDLRNLVVAEREA